MARFWAQQIGILQCSAHRPNHMASDSQHLFSFRTLCSIGCTSETTSIISSNIVSYTGRQLTISKFAWQCTASRGSNKPKGHAAAAALQQGRLLERPANTPRTPCHTFVTMCSVYSSWYLESSCRTSRRCPWHKHSLDSTWPPTAKQVNSCCEDVMAGNSVLHAKRTWVTYTSRWVCDAQCIWRGHLVQGALARLALAVGWHPPAS